MPSAGSDTWAYERQRLIRRRRRARRRQQMLWLLTVLTTAVLVVIGVGVRDLARQPEAAKTAALSASASARPTARASARGSAPAASPRPAALPAYPRVSDPSSGLSYRQYSSPWRHGCPADLDTPMFSWSAGENAVAGQVTIGGSAIDWHASACSGQLQQQFAYSGPADLRTTATSLVGAIDPAYYSGIQHDLQISDSSPTQVSGNQAWAVRFQVNYSNDAGQGVAWSTESGAVVVVDRGQSQPPAVFYVSVPGNLDTSEVGTLIGSLRMSGPASSG